MDHDIWHARTLEGRLEENHHMGLAPGFFHSSVGQEASLLSCAHALEDTDSLFPGYRSHGLTLIAGTQARR